jgi:hypothetical protein
LFLLLGDREIMFDIIVHAPVGMILCEGKIDVVPFGLIFDFITLCLFPSKLVLVEI